MAVPGGSMASQADAGSSPLNGAGTVSTTDTSMATHDATDMAAAGRDVGGGSGDGVGAGGRACIGDTVIANLR